LSQIEWFVVPAMAVDTVKDRARDTVLPKRPGKPIPPGGRPPFTPKPRPLEWGIPYEELASGRPIEFAPKTSLREGEQITLRVTVTGIQEPNRLSLPRLELRNMTPGVVRLEGGDVQTISIRPEDVSSEGTFTFTRTLTGIRPGGFAIVCQAKHKEGPLGQQKPPPQEPPHSPDKKKEEACQCKNVEVKFPALYWREYQIGESQWVLFGVKGVLGGIRFNVSPPVDLKISCTDPADKGKRCSARVKFSVKLPEETVKVQWTGGGEPQDAKVALGSVKPKETSISAPCGGQEDKRTNPSVPVWIRFPRDLVEWVLAKNRPEYIDVEEIEFTLSWTIEITCGEKTESHSNVLNVKIPKFRLQKVFELNGPDPSSDVGKPGGSPSLFGLQADSFYDNDGDGWTNYEEKWAGTDPNDGNDRPDKQNKERKPFFTPEKKP
jgi:hypothetical protein